MDKNEEQRTALPTITKEDCGNRKSSENPENSIQQQKMVRKLDENMVFFLLRGRNSASLDARERANEKGECILDNILKWGEKYTTWRDGCEKCNKIFLGYVFRTSCTKNVTILSFVTFFAIVTFFVATRLESWDVKINQTKFYWAHNVLWYSNSKRCDISFGVQFIVNTKDGLVFFTLFATIHP